jgi:LPS-assembly protein
MSFIRIFKKSIWLITAINLLLPLGVYAQNKDTRDALANALLWVQTNRNSCGGYFLEPAISSTENQQHPDTVQIISNQLLYSIHGTSESLGKITIRRYGQEIRANKAYLYRDPITGKLNTGVIDLIGNVNLREPNTLVLSNTGRFNFRTKAPSLIDVLYRTAIYSETKPQSAMPQQITTEHKLYQLSAWGKAATFNQPKPKVYDIEQATYTTCPPTQSVWSVKTDHLILNKETGRGTATHARLLLKGVPIFYTPYLNFPIDHRRQTGFLWPNFGSNERSGAFFRAPFYWNMAPNHDMLITPLFLAKRGVQITDNFRYLTPKSSGHIKIAALPNDKAFGTYQHAIDTTPMYANSTDTRTQAELRRLLNASTTRKSIIWQDSTHYNEHWSSDIDYNYVSDDYYLRDLSTEVNLVTENQLLQQVTAAYKGQVWNVTGRAQSYQTVHLIDTPNPVNNQYNRYPQLILNGLYPDEKTDVEYSISNEFTHFTILNNPGDPTKQPMGNRINIQPGISRPINLPYFYFAPRLQVEATQYQLGDVINTNPKNPSRTLPIFNISSGLYFDRNLTLLSQEYIQTLEPQLYYTYIPYRNQNDLPVFDTYYNQLTYDQLFMYNRFSGIDRIGDANQISIGVTTRAIDQQSGNEKILAGVGQILYFRNRRVTLCKTPGCSDNPADPNDNKRNRSPYSGVIKYSVNPHWTLQSYTIWDPLVKKQKLTNQSLILTYHADNNLLLTFAYGFVKDGDRYPHDFGNKYSNNLSQTDISGAVPVTQNWSLVGRWTQNLNRHNFQNLLFGVQYDSCCWAVRLVGAKEFLNLNPNNTALYNTEVYLQFALKGLGNLGTGDPTQLLTRSISGYNTQFGQDY